MLPAPLTTPFAAASDASLTGWRIDYVAGAAEASREATAIDDSGDFFACAAPVDAEQLLSGRATIPSDLEILAVALTASPDAQGRAEAWVRAEGAVVEARQKTTRVLIARRRAMVQAPVEQLSDSMDAVVRYCAIAGSVETLENTVALRLSDLGVRALSQAEAARAKRSLLRWQRAIEQFQPGISQHSRRLFGELDEAGRLEERIEMLEDPVQTLYDFCALASERKHYNVGIVIEVAILVVLLCELAAMALQLTRSGGG